jgi:hypothetical protein
LAAVVLVVCSMQHLKPYQALRQSLSEQVEQRLHLVQPLAMMEQQQHSRD